MDVIPFRCGWGVLCRARFHQSSSESSWLGHPSGNRNHARTSCQICWVNGHAMMMWWIVSKAWSHRRHRGWCCRPRRARRSAVQHLSCCASSVAEN